jgi:flagellar hook-associated protein FlgK
VTNNTNRKQTIEGKIASLDQKIRQAAYAGSTSLPNLRKQRKKLVAELANLIKRDK